MFGKSAAICLLQAASTACKPFNKAAISKQRYVVNRATSAAALERTTSALNGLLDLAGERRLIDSLSAKLRGETAQRVVPARGGASAVGGGGGADETPPTEVVHLRRELAKMQKEKLEASAAMVKLTLEHRGVVRELRQSQSHAGALERDFNVRLSTAQAVNEAEQRESQQAHNKVEKALRQRNKELKEKLKKETADWSLYAKRLKNKIIDAVRETVAELRGFYVSEHLVWQEANREAAVLLKCCVELVELVDRVRNSRRGVLVAEVDRLVDQRRELTQRRTLNARRMSDANLEARRAAVSEEAAGGAGTACGALELSCCPLRAGLPAPRRACARARGALEGAQGASQGRGRRHG